MKNQFLNITASLLLVGSLTVSCNKCGSKTTETTTTTITTTTTDSTDMGSVPPNDGANIDNTSGATNSKGTTQSAATATKTKATDKDGKSLEGYSAPDGTAAENHDGDQYTKNNNKPMPTGPPIK